MKKVLSILLSVIILTGVFTAMPFTATGAEVEKASVSAESGDFEYEILDDGTAEIKGYFGDATELEIPDTLDGYIVTSIGWFAFEDCTSLNSITIPDSVTSIGYDAFKNTAYYNNQDNWENNVLYIGNHLIKAKEDITGSYQIKDGTITIADAAFSECTSLKSVTIPNSITSIGGYTFAWCDSLESITIPNSVTSIGDDAFYNCTSLASITIPSSVTSIGYWAFHNTAYYNNQDNWENNVLYIGNYLITAKEDITGSYQIKDGTITVANSAFSECTSLESVIIPNSITSIEDWAFSGCQSLTSITIPNSVTSIGNSAFCGCESFTSITIPNSVTSIGWFAFADCTSLESVTIPNSVTSIGDEAFYGCESLKSITIPNGVTSIGEGTFFVCTSLESITIPNSVTSIDDGAFALCTSLKDVYYSGSESLWNSIEIDVDNECLTNANIHFLSSILGDVDGDGEVGIMDATLIQMYLAKLRTLDEQQLIIADSDASGSVDILDATTIQMYLAKLIDHLGK